MKKGDFSEIPFSYNEESKTVTIGEKDVLREC